MGIGPYIVGITLPLLYAGMLLTPNLLLVQAYPDLDNVLKLAIAVAMLTAWVFCFRSLRSAVRYSLPFAALAPVDAAFVWEYNQPPTAAVLAILADTNPTEAMDYLRGREALACGALAFGLTLWFGALKVAPRRPVLVRHRGTRMALRLASRAGMVGCLALALAGFVPGIGQLLPGLFPGGSIATASAMPLQVDRTRGVFPFGRLVSVSEFLLSRRDAEAVQQELQRFRFGATRTHARDGKEIFVLVVGETGRPDRWGLGGYERDTTPKLGKRPNLVYLGDMVSPWSYTLAAVPVIVSRKDEADRSLIFPEASIVTLFKEAGFETYVISNQAMATQATSPMQLVAGEAGKALWLNPYANDVFGKGSLDEVVLAPLAEIVNRPEKRQFILIHLLGSHDSYDRRYPQSFNRFRPSLNDDPRASHGHVRNRELVRNSYDNSVLYSDHVLDAMLDVLERADAASVLYFVADHGEDLFDGECTKRGHGDITRRNFPVPAFVWFSSEFVADHPAAVGRVRENASRRLSTSATFSTMADLAGIAYGGADPSRSIASPHFRERVRIVNAPFPIEWDRAEFLGACERLSAPRMASDWPMTVPPSFSAGTRPCGLACRYSGWRCWPPSFSRCRGMAS